MAPKTVPDYDDVLAISDVSLKVEPGKIVAMVGSMTKALVAGASAFAGMATSVASMRCMRAIPAR